MSYLSLECRHRFEGGFSLDLELTCEHAVTSLFGPSGSGKTSALSVVAGLLRPDFARVRIGERVVHDSEAGVFVPPEERHVGFVFQDHLLFPHMSVERNIVYGAQRASDGSDISFDRVVEVLELGDLLPRRPGSLSGGQQQRVALGRALLSRPELILMDEPLAALDDSLKERIMEFLVRAMEEWHIPTVLVSHGQDEVRRLADWVYVVEGGGIVGQGTPAEALP